MEEGRKERRKKRRKPEMHGLFLRNSDYSVTSLILEHTLHYINLKYNLHYFYENRWDLFGALSQCESDRKSENDNEVY